MTHTTAMLHAERLGRRFGGRWVFRGVEFDLLPGQVLAITGANGSGKSTLLKVLAGLLAPSEGAVRGPAKIGYAALDLALYAQLSAPEHLALAARYRGLAPDPAALERVGLGEAGAKRVAAFSTGMRARLKLALALQHAPPVVLLDEPSAALDEAGRSLLAELLRTGPAFVLATNDDRDLEHATHRLHLD